MSISLTIEWEGLEALRRYLARIIPEALEKAALEALDAATEEGVEYAKTVVPVDTGALRRSIRQEPRPRREGDGYEAGITAGGGGVVNPKTGREVNYAAYVEYGTSRAPAQPYLRPGLLHAAMRLPLHFYRILRRLIEVG
ncbi:MAG TPA: HK97 gp10 family phage protein [Candidatus Bathyarchaeota archaeon]|nr:HK97 gp10 family phage protein [Candidatus Bathyarchaeota archaeon]